MALIVIVTFVVKVYLLWYIVMCFVLFYLTHWGFLFSIFKILYVLLYNNVFKGVKDIIYFLNMYQINSETCLSLFHFVTSGFAILLFGI